MAGAALAQAPAHDSPASDSTQFLPHLQYKPDKDKLTYTPDLLKKNKTEEAAPASAGENPEDVTLFYSTMPMAKIKGRRPAPMEASKADSTRHYHLLKKRYQVVPLHPETKKPVLKPQD